MTTAWERAGRPKPPRINRDSASWEYMYEHGIYVVWQSSISGRWYVDSPDVSEDFPTHGEAIAFAQAQARKDTQ